MHFAGFQHWNMVILAAWMFCCGHHVSLGRAGVLLPARLSPLTAPCTRAVMTWFPFLIIVGLILVVKYAA